MGDEALVALAAPPEAAPTAGLTQTSSTNLGAWIGSRLVQPKSGRVAKR